MKQSNPKIRPPVTIFKNTLNVYRFMLVTPYFITYSQDQERAILRYPNIVVKVAFIIVQGLTVVFMCCKAFKQFIISESLDALPILALSHVAWLALNITVIEFVWRRMSCTLDMMNLLSDIYRKCTPFELNGRAVKLIMKIPWFLGLFGVLWVLLDVAMMLRRNEKSPWGMRKSIIDSAYSEYFISNNFSFTNAEVEDKCRNPAVFVFSLPLISYHPVSGTAEAKILNQEEQNIFLDNWKPPKEILDNFPYYVSGFDVEKRPVFIFEIGKWPIRIVDWEGFSLSQLTHGPTVQYILHHFTAFQRIQDSFAYGFYLNVNTFASQFISLAKPILGSALER
ncbi:unnamed protein product, partial [Allacma fusca]